MGTIFDWIDDRLHLKGQLKSLADEDMEPGIGYLHSLGSCLLSLMLLLVVTGIFLAFNYSPSPDHAHDSIRFMERHVLFGKYIRGLHHWAAGLAIIVLLMHAIFVFAHAAYKRPREITWMVGVCLFLTVFAFAFVGYLLPWDQKGYWATVVAANVARNVPLIGDSLKRLIVGGDEFGAATLSRFYAVHTLVLPALLLLFISLHLFMVRRLGVSGTWVTPTEPRKPNKFYPHQIFRNMVLVLAVYTIAFVVAATVPARLEAVANPNDTSYVPRPEWYFTPMFEFFKHFKGRLEPVGTILIPVLSVIFLLLLPLLDRTPGRAPRTRPYAISAVAFVVILTLALGLKGAATPPPPQAAKKPPALTGEALYAANNCSSCHQLNGKGGAVGPALDDVGKRRTTPWIIEHFKNPQALVPGSVMPSYGRLSTEQLEALTDYLLKQSQAQPIAPPAGTSSDQTQPTPSAAEAQPQTEAAAPPAPAPPTETELALSAGEPQPQAEVAVPPASPSPDQTEPAPPAAEAQPQTEAAAPPAPEAAPTEAAAGSDMQPQAAPPSPAAGGPQPPITSYAPQHFPLLGRSLAIGLTANFHIVFAAFLLGGPIVAVFLEWFGLRRREDFYDHLARGLTKVMVICFSIGATFGVTLVVLLTGLFPRFWAGWLNVFFWPLLLEALMFFLEAASLYAYYYTWDRFAQRRRLHMSFGLLNVVSGTATMVIINAVAAAMLTPPADLAQRPWAWATMYLSNPTWFPLTLHRFVANVSLTGFLLAMWAGYAFLKAKNPEQRAFRDLAGHAGILLGLAGLFLLPPIGILYVLEIRRASPPGFVNLMLGPTRYIFNIQIILLTALFVLSNWYLLFRTAANHPSRTLHRLLLVVSILSAILAILPYNIGGGRHIVLGKMHFKYLGLAVLGLITIYSLATQRKNARTLPWGAASRAPQVGLVALGLVAFAIMNVMGFARETARHPYLVFNQMPLKEETNLGEQAVAGPGDELGASCPFLPAKAPPQQPKAETPQETGARLYADNGCSGCHVLQGNGGTVGPALDAVGSRHDVDWMIAHFKDPQALVPGSAMPKYDLPEDQLRALSEYLATFK